MQLQIYPAGATVSWDDEDVDHLVYESRYSIEIIEFEDLSRMAYELGGPFVRLEWHLAHLTSTDYGNLKTFWDGANGKHSRLALTGFNATTYAVRWINRFNFQLTPGLHGRYNGSIILQEYTP